MPDIGSWSNRSSAMAGSTAASRSSLPNWPGATFADHADAIVAAAGSAEDVTLVAQSMGAFSAPLACDRLPVAELVLLNAMIPAPGETAGEWWGNTGQAEAMRSNDLREGRDPDAGFDAQIHFLHDLPPEVLDTVDVVRR